MRSVLARAATNLSDVLLISNIRCLSKDFGDLLSLLSSVVALLDDGESLLIVSNNAQMTKLNRRARRNSGYDCAVSIGSSCNFNNGFLPSLA